MLDSVAIITFSLAILTFAVGVGQTRRKHQIEIFQQFSSRYNEIVTPEILPDWIMALEGEAFAQKRCQPVMIRYLNLLWEEIYLRESRMIDERLFQVWRPSIEEVLESEFAQRITKENKYHFPPISELQPAPLTLKARIVDFLTLY